MKRFFLILTAVILFPLALSAKGEKEGVIAMSYNIRYGTASDGTNSWQYRYGASAMMLDDQKPDVVGLQEALSDQVQYLTMALDKTYKAVGVGRDDGKRAGEIMAIFYNKKTVKLLKWGTYWLSDTPDVPSKGWDAACFRTATWALLKDKASGKKFFYVNTHLDHVGWEARRKGLALIVERIAAMNPKGLPMVLTGDFNMRIDRPEFDDLKQIMENAREVAARTDHHNTYNGWGKASKEEIIDYIWFKGFSACTEYETITKPYMERTFISDHYPIRATLIF